MLPADNYDPSKYDNSRGDTDFSTMSDADFVKYMRDLSRSMGSGPRNSDMSSEWDTMKLRSLMEASPQDFGIDAPGVVTFGKNGGVAFLSNSHQLIVSVLGTDDCTCGQDHPRNPADEYGILLNVNGEDVFLSYNMLQLMATRAYVSQMGSTDEATKYERWDVTEIMGSTEDDEEDQ